MDWKAVFKRRCFLKGNTIVCHLIKQHTSGRQFCIILLSLAHAEQQGSIYLLRVTAPKAPAQPQPSPSTAMRSGEKRSALRLSWRSHIQISRVHKALSLFPALDPIREWRNCGRRGSQAGTRRLDCADWQGLDSLGFGLARCDPHTQSRRRAQARVSSGGGVSSTNGPSPAASATCSCTRSPGCKAGRH